MKRLALSALVLILATPAFARVHPLAGAVPEDDDDDYVRYPWLVERSLGETTAPDLPPAFDWRRKDGKDWMSPVREAQGECGACVSFAAVSALESQLAIACGTPERDFGLSRQWFFSCGGGTCRGGWKASSAIDFLAQSGVPDGPCLPWLGRDVDCTAGCSDALQRAVKPVAYERVTTGFVDVVAIKRALLRGPLVSTLILYEDLVPHGGGVYRHKTGNQLGSHAVVLVGWSDADKAWLARNSWGPEWGDKGYFAVAWDDASLPGRYTWLLDVSKAKEGGACALPR